MSQLFSDILMDDLQDTWNHDAGVYTPFVKANFTADIAYGLKAKIDPED